MTLVLAFSGTADAKPRLAGVFDLTGTPERIAAGPDGNIWVTLSNSSDDMTLARIKPNGVVDEFDPAAVVNPEGISGGPDGNVWVTRNGGVAKVPPDDPMNAVDFDIDAIGNPEEITRGPQNRLWTASGDQLVSFLPANPAGFDATTIDGVAPSARGSRELRWQALCGGLRRQADRPDESWRGRQVVQGRWRPTGCRSGSAQGRRLHERRVGPPDRRPDRGQQEAEEDEGPEHRPVRNRLREGPQMVDRRPSPPTT